MAVKSLLINTEGYLKDHVFMDIEINSWCALQELPSNTMVYKYEIEPYYWTGVPKRVEFPFTTTLYSHIRRYLRRKYNINIKDAELNFLVSDGTIEIYREVDRAMRDINKLESGEYGTIYRQEIYLNIKVGGSRIDDSLAGNIVQTLAKGVSNEEGD